MDSTTTLVNPTPIQLDFSTNSFTSTTLSISGFPLYRITTPGQAGQRTEVVDVTTNEPIITIKTRDLLPDTISFKYHHGGKSIGLKKWLKRSSAPDGSYIFSFETDSGLYEWKPHPEHWIALYHTNNPTSPIAYLIKGRATPSIFMEAGTETFRDLILASMLVAERDIKGVQNFQSPDMQRRWGEVQVMFNLTAASNMM